jgi:catechol 2,3-dioxygenase-like lactoylglutathione lyase family enzyme
MMRISVQYTIMIVKSLEESVSVYRDIMGFQEGYHVDFPVGQQIFVMDPNGVRICLIEHTAEYRQKYMQENKITSSSSMIELTRNTMR